MRAKPPGHRGTPRDATGRHGTPRDATGCHGMPRDATGCHGMPRDATGSAGMLGMPRDATRCHAMDWVAPGCTVKPLNYETLLVCPMEQCLAVSCVRCIKLHSGAARIHRMAWLRHLLCTTHAPRPLQPPRMERRPRSLTRGAMSLVSCISRLRAVEYSRGDLPSCRGWISVFSSLLLEVTSLLLST